MFKFPILVGDIGGTNARFTMLQDAHSEAGPVFTTRVADHTGIEAAIEQTVLSRSSAWPKTIILAIAGPRVPCSLQC